MSEKDQWEDTILGNFPNKKMHMCVHAHNFVKKIRVRTQKVKIIYLMLFIIKDHHIFLGTHLTFQASNTSEAPQHAVAPHMLS